MKKSNDLKKFFSIPRHLYTYKSYKKLGFVVVYKDTADKFNRKYLFLENGKKVLGCSLAINVFEEEGNTYIYRRYYCLKQNKTRRLKYLWKNNKLACCEELEERYEEQSYDKRCT